MKIEVEIKEVKVHTTASLDKEIVIKLVTSDISALELAKYINEKTVIIEAIQWDGKNETLADIQKLNTLKRGLSVEEDFVGDRKSLMIETLEGTHEGKIGDWIIQGVSGELYPCKPDIFEMTYEKV